MEGGVVRYDDGHVNGGQKNDDVPTGLEEAVVAEYPTRALGRRSLVLGKGLDVGSRRWATQ